MIMKNAFTMIELIFVIVIIGIIAAVAVPILNATRDDAKISTIITNTHTVITDAKSFYTSKGNIKWKVAKITDMTDVPLYADVSCTILSRGITIGKFYICDKSGNNAINIVTFKTTDKGSLIVTTKGGSLIANAVANNKIMIGLANVVTVGKKYMLGGAVVIRH